MSRNRNARHATSRDRNTKDLVVIPDQLPVRIETEGGSLMICQPLEEDFSDEQVIFVHGKANVRLLIAALQAYLGGAQ